MVIIDCKDKGIADMLIETEIPDFELHHSEGSVTGN